MLYTGTFIVAGLSNECLPFFSPPLPFGELKRFLLPCFSTACMATPLPCSPCTALSYVVHFSTANHRLSPSTVDESGPPELHCCSIFTTAFDKPFWAMKILLANAPFN